ncbi:beta strand repeat-containing protein, partial [Tsuneonella sp. SYSU-LHT278]|uniref:beta strand repeat-containing protein n=1 Tax=Tsuneonella sediminis TaxID=3416089 RepID=UPI003F795EAC
MTAKHRSLRLRMLATTATAALLALPGAAHAQLVSSGDLVTAEDSAGNPNQITITNPNASTANISVLAPVVVANWNQFNVPTGTILNVSNASAAAQASLLNRVIGGGFSDIGGTINAADVNFWLVNQNGILFGGSTSVNAASFYASTLDVTDADFFDFYEGTDLAGNGSNSIQFVTNPAATTILAAPAGASFVTNGTLFFGGPQLNLTGTFDAGSGTASFVAATDVTVNFSAGSPVSYTIPAGTTVASQLIDGTVTGNAADFVFQTAAGVMGAMLTVNADVATTAAPTERGILLYTGGPSTASVTVGGAWSSTGGVEANVNSDLTFSQDLSGSYATLQAAGGLSAQDITATAGAIDIDAGSVSAGVLKATGDLTVDAAGPIALTAAVSDSDGVGGGALAIGATTLPSSLTISGSTSGASVDLQASGNVSLGFVASGAGNVDIDSTGGNISASFVSASGGDALLTAPGAITTGGISASNAIDVDSTAGGALDLGTLNAGTTISLDTSGSAAFGAATAGGAFTIGGSVDPSSITATGTVLAGSVDFDTTGLLSAQTIEARAGAIDIDAGSVSAGVLKATGDLTVDAAGPIALTAAVSDSDGVGGGALAIGATTLPSSLTISGSTSGASVDLQASGNVSLGFVASGAGNVDIDSTGGNISASFVSASGGDALLTAPGSITTGGISASNAIDVDSTAGGALDLGTLNAGTTIALDTSGSFGAAGITAGGALTVGSNSAPSSVLLTGDVVAGSATIFSTGSLTAQDVTATTGDVYLVGEPLVAGNVTAAQNLFFATVTNSGTVTFDSATATNGLVAVNGAVPDTITVTGATTGASVQLYAIDVLDLGDVTSTAGVVLLDTALFGAGSGSISAGNVSATGGQARLVAPDGITTTSISSTAAIDVDSTAGGALDLGTLNAGTTISLDTSGSAAFGAATAGGAFTIGGSVDPSSITATGTVLAGSVDFDTTGLLSAQTIEARAGAIDIDAGSVSAGVLKATGDLTVDAAGPIALTAAVSDSDGVGGGALAIGATTLPSSLTISGSTSG